MYIYCALDGWNMKDVKEVKGDGADETDWEVCGWREH